MEFYTKGKYGAESPWASVEFHGGVYWDEMREKWVDRTDIVPGLGGLELEEMAMLLADKVERNFPGQGQRAFESAKLQLLNRDYNGEWKELQHKMEVHKMWGGPVPAAVFLPSVDQGGQWDAIIPDKSGIPIQYSVKEKALQDWRPPDNSNARMGEFGWETKPPPPAVQRNRRERRRAKAALR